MRTGLAGQPGLHSGALQVIDAGAGKQYADAKTAVVLQILARAQAARPGAEP